MAKALLTHDQLVQLEALASVLTQRQAADYMGLTHETLQRRLERQPEARAAWDRGKAKAIAAVAKTVLEKAREGNMTAAIFFLKTQARWSETVKQEISGPEGAPLGMPTTIVVTTPSAPALPAGGPRFLPGEAPPDDDPNTH